MNTKHLVNKNVFFKMAHCSQSEGTVAAAEDHGLWIHLASNFILEGVSFPKGVEDRVVFVPFHQLEWLVKAV